MTDFVYDTFTGSGALASHTGETGATWAIDTYFNSNPGMVLSGGTLTRPPWPDSNSYGTRACYASGVISGDYDINLSFSLANYPDNSSLRLYAKLGAARTSLAELYIYPGGGIRAGSASVTAFSFTNATTYALRVEVRGTSAAVYVDDALISSGSLADVTGHTLSFLLYEQNGASVISVLDLRVAPPPAPPGPSDPFWTAYVLTTETLT